MNSPFHYYARDAAPPLRPFIGHLFYARGRVTYRRERILPTGAPSLLINLGDPFRCHGLDYDESLEIRRAGWLAGQQTRALINEPLGETHVVGASFKPFGASAVLGLSMHELTDRSMPIDVLWGSRSEGLRDHLAELPTPEAKLSLLERWLIGQTSPDGAWHDRLAYAAARLAQSRPCSIRDLASELAVSHKQLIARFHRHVGIAPMALNRLLRLKRAVEIIARPGTPNFAAAALSAGYADQSHFNRDFRYFSGLRPTDYTTRRRAVYGPDADETPQFLPG